MGCADVCIDVDYGSDGPELFTATMRVARKAHQCCECREAVAVGQRYERVDGRTDGEWWSRKTCALCVEIREALVCGDFVYGRLWNEIKDQVFPEWERFTPLDCLAKIESLEARDKLRKAYADWKGVAA